MYVVIVMGSIVVIGVIFSVDIVVQTEILSSPLIVKYPSSHTELSLFHCLINTASPIIKYSYLLSQQLSSALLSIVIVATDRVVTFVITVKTLVVCWWYALLDNTNVLMRDIVGGLYVLFCWHGCCRLNIIVIFVNHHPSLQRNILHHFVFIIYGIKVFLVETKLSMVSRHTPTHWLICCNRCYPYNTRHSDVVLLYNPPTSLRDCVKALSHYSNICRRQCCDNNWLVYVLVVKVTKVAFIIQILSRCVSTLVPSYWFCCQEYQIFRYHGDRSGIVPVSASFLTVM